MNRRALILEELELTPLWVRRELWQADEQEDIATQALPADQIPRPEEITPNLEPQARHPLPPVARAANRAIAPMLGQTPAAKPTHAPVDIEPVATTGQAPQPANPRADEIARMDWDALQASVNTCSACALCQSRQQAVFGVGNPAADLVIVGEAPGAEEDQQGEPFVGRAGKLLDAMLASIGEKRGERVYIANVLKCRPPGNRNPLPDEIGLCTPYLLRQLELIAPKVILAAGRFAAHTLLQTDAPLSALRGKTHDWRGIPVLVTYHPAYLLRNLPDKAKAWDDLLRLSDILAKRKEPVHDQ